jgi:ATP phosphoribosyltransferase
MQAGVLTLMADAGIHVRGGARDYRPEISLAGVSAKLLRPQNIVEMLHVGSRDVGFAGADWVAELDARVVELMDTGLDPVTVVAAAPEELVARGWPPPGRLTVASEYQRLARAWIRGNQLDARLVRSYGATEVFPPEDADCIVDNTATGSTLRANGLQAVDELMGSSTRLYAHPQVLSDTRKRAIVDRLVLLLCSVLESRRRVMVEVNVSGERLDAVIEALPCMREPTVSRLHGCGGYAVKAAVPRADLPRVIPEVKARGGTDIVVSKLAQIVP